MAIRQKSFGAHAVIKVLENGLPKKVSLSSYEELVKELTKSEITEINRYLKANYPELAELIWESKEIFPDDFKFEVRQAMLGMAVALITARQPAQIQTRKLHQL